MTTAILIGLAAWVLYRLLSPSARVVWKYRREIRARLRP